MDLSKPSHLFGLITAIIIVIIAVLFFMKKNTPPTTEQLSPASAQSVAAPEAPQTNTAAKTTPLSAMGAVIKTNFGEIEVSFFAADAPKTVDNFKKLVASGFYERTKFHRVIKNFMIQGGDPLTKDDSQMGRWGTGGSGYTFADEINRQKLVRGVLAMANSGPNTNGSQFFIVTAAATPWLDGHHTVFGKVVRGMDVVDKIESTPTGERDIPKTPIVIKDILLK